LKGLKFKGRDKNSRKVVEVLDELFKFKSFSEEDKEKLCLGMLFAKGMNVELKGIVRALG